MTFDPFALIRQRLEEASEHLTEMGRAIIHPRHKPGFTSTHAAIMSCPWTIIAHDWQGPFERGLNGFLTATRSVPDIITKQLGYDPHGMRLPWHTRLAKALKRRWHGPTTADEETKRRKKFQRKFEKKFAKFRQHPLSEERHEVIHRSGLPHWEVRVKGRFRTYVGGPMNPLPLVEEFPHITGEDPAFWVLADSSPMLVEPMAADFCWVIPQPGGAAKTLPLFDECRAFLQAARDLEALARRLYQDIHQGHQLTSPPW
jgi:hypothetical protein